MKNYKISALNEFLLSRGITSLGESSNSEPYTLITINNLPIYARLANSPQLLEKGLMGVERLDPNEGCLLDFNKEVQATLWMRNCKMNLQAATIDNNGKIIDILNMYHNDPYRVHRSSRPVRYALEMSEGFFTKFAIRVGDSVRLSDNRD